MRLGQLARKLGKRTTDIVEFLATQQVSVENGTNIRMEDTHVLLAVGHFAPELKDEILGVRDEAAENEDSSQASDPIMDEAVVEEKEERISETTVTNTVEESVPNEAEKIEVIKAPKVELSGLKVLGKIELPEPKKKDAKVEENSTSENGTTAEPQRFDRRRAQRRDDRPQRPRKNPVAQQREREEAEARKRKEEEKQKQKERKKQHYYNKVQVSAPVRKVRRGEEHEMMDDVRPSQPMPTSWWGKFKRWLTS